MELRHAHLLCQARIEDLALAQRGINRRHKGGWERNTAHRAEHAVRQGLHACMCACVCVHANAERAVQ